MIRLAAPFALLLLACQSSPTSVGKAEAWPEADRLFHADPRWLGGDSAYSIDLGANRVLWLFGDSFIATGGGLTRAQSTLVHNSVAIQTGYDPTSAAMAFYWATRNGAPASLFPEVGAEWLWPGHGARLGDRLILFFMRIKSDPGTLGFLTDAAKALLVDNPDDPPTQWITHPIALPPNGFGVLLGAGGCTVLGAFLDCFSPVEPGNHDIYLIRWAVADAMIGNLSRPDWYAGPAGWVAGSSLTERPPPIFTGGQTELSVHFDSLTRRFIEVQTDGFGGANLATRDALLLEGAWSPLETLFRPLESNNPNTLVYSAKAHPELSGGATAITYCTNNTDWNALLNDPNIYFPRFVKLTLMAR